MNSKEDSLEQLLNHKGNTGHNKIWRGSYAMSLQKAQVINTGYKQLNQQLHSAGWPLTITTELCLSSYGIGELRLLMPALRALLQQQHSSKNILWVAPPYLPFAPALIKEGIDTNKVTIVKTNNIQDTLWATEQALLAQCCAAVFCWTGKHDLSTRELRRLQLASEKSRTWNILFRHADCLQQSSCSGLRIHLQTNLYSQLNLHILKQPNGWGGQRCTLSLAPYYENWQRLPVNLLPQPNKPASKHIDEYVKPLKTSKHRQSTVTVLISLAALNVVH